METKNTTLKKIGKKIGNTIYYLLDPVTVIIGNLSIGAFVLTPMAIGLATYDGINYLNTNNVGNIEITKKINNFQKDDLSLKINENVLFEDYIVKVKKEIVKKNTLNIDGKNYFLKDPNNNQKMILTCEYKIPKNKINFPVNNYDGLVEVMNKIKDEGKFEEYKLKGIYQKNSIGKDLYVNNPKKVCSNLIDEINKDYHLSKNHQQGYKFNGKINNLEKKITDNNVFFNF